MVAFGRLISWAVPGLLGGVVGGAIATLTRPEIGVGAIGGVYLLIAVVALTRLRRITGSSPAGTPGAGRTGR